MTLKSLIQEVGEKLLNRPQALVTPSPGSMAAPDIAALDDGANQAIERYIGSHGLNADDLDVKYDGTTQTVTVSCVAPYQGIKRKIIVYCSTVQSLVKVNELPTNGSGSEPEMKYREVKWGDTLSKIAKEEYGDANAYVKIFDANKPILARPDKLCPGQKLRIPPK